MKPVIFTKSGKPDGRQRPSKLAHDGDSCSLCEARARGLSIREIAEVVGMSENPVRLHVLHVKTPQQKAREEAQALIAAGVPYREITRLTGIFPSALVALNRRHELSVRKIGRPKLIQNIYGEQERVA